MKERLISSKCSKVSSLYPYNILNRKQVDYLENVLGGVMLECDYIDDDLFLLKNGDEYQKIE